MASYSYPNAPIIPPNPADQTGLVTNYGAAPPAYNRYLPGAQPDQSQWNQANAAYGQPAAPVAPQYQTYDQAAAYNGKCYLVALDMSHQRSTNRLSKKFDFHSKLNRTNP